MSKAEKEETGAGQSVLDRLKLAYDALQEAKVRESVAVLRARADMAEVIEEAHKEGYTNYRIAQYLETDRTAVARMSSARWVPPGQKVPTTAAVLARERAVPGSAPPVPKRGSEPSQRPSEARMKVPRHKLTCRYCDDKAAYAVQHIDGKSIMVCEKHKPKE